MYDNVREEERLLLKLTDISLHSLYSSSDIEKSLWLGSKRHPPPQKKELERFNVFTTLKIRVELFWVVAPCSVLVGLEGKLFYY
jgi:hypothetical protein